MNKDEILSLLENDENIKIALLIKQGDEVFIEKLREALKENYSAILSLQDEEEKEVYLSSKIKEIEDEFNNLDEEEREVLLENFSLRESENKEDEEISEAIKEYEQGNLEKISIVILSKREELKYEIERRKGKFIEVEKKVREYFLKNNKELFFKNNRKRFFNILNKGV